MARIRPLDHFFDRRRYCVNDLDGFFTPLFLLLFVFFLDIRGERPFDILGLRLCNQSVELLPKISIPYVFLDIAKLLELRNINSHGIFCNGVLSTLNELLHDRLLLPVYSIGQVTKRWDPSIPIFTYIISNSNITILQNFRIKEKILFISYNE